MDLQTKIRLNGDTSEQSSSEQSQQPADLFQVSGRTNALQTQAYADPDVLLCAQILTN